MVLWRSIVPHFYTFIHFHPLLWPFSYMYRAHNISNWRICFHIHAAQQSARWISRNFNLCQIRRSTTKNTACVSFPPTSFFLKQKLQPKFIHAESTNSSTQYYEFVCIVYLHNAHLHCTIKCKRVSSSETSNFQTTFHWQNSFYFSCANYELKKVHTNIIFQGDSEKKNIV